MIELKTREHLVYFMQCGVLRLGRNDLKFVQNINTNIVQNKPVTSNQVKLFNKLVDKYSRQLKAHGINEDKVNKLDWQCKVISSEPFFTDATISLKDGNIYLRSPYNRNFINAVRNDSNSTFIWNKLTKRYESVFSTVALKFIVNHTHKFYKDVNYCPYTTELLNKICKYNEEDIWEPTLIKINNNYYIASINESLSDAVKHIPLSNDIRSLDELSRHGVKVHKSVINNDKRLEFLSNYKVTVELSDIEDVVSWLAELNCSTVYFSGTIKLKNEFFEKFKTQNVFSMNKFIKDKTVVPSSDKNYSVLIKLSGYFPSSMHQIDVMKIIEIKNSEPIDIK